MKSFKKLVSIFSALTLIIGIISVMPVSSAEEIPPYDYSSFVGKWDWDLSVPYAGDYSNWYTYDEAWVKILDVWGNNARLEYYHQRGGQHLYEYDTCIGTITGSTITAHTYARKGGGPVLDEFTLTLSLGDNSIWFEAYNDTQDGLAFSGVFISSEAVPRRIEAGNYSVVLNGSELEFDQPPVMCGSRILVPMRKIFEELGASVDYEDLRDKGSESDTQRVFSVSAKKDNTEVELAMVQATGSTYWWYRVDKDGKFGEINRFKDASPVFINDRILVPVRVVSEAFGAQVDWNDETQTVIINTNK